MIKQGSVDVCITDEIKKLNNEFVWLYSGYIESGYIVVTGTDKRIIRKIQMCCDCGS